MGFVTIGMMTAVTAANFDDTAQFHVWDKNAHSRRGTVAQLRTQLHSADALFPDALYDIGKSGATRPRDLFLSRNLTIGGAAAGFTTLAVSNRITSTYTSPDAFISSSAGTSHQWVRLQNTSGDMIVGVESSAGGGAVSGSTGYASFVGSAAAKPVHIVYNDAVHTTFGASGAITATGAISGVTTFTFTGQLKSATSNSGTALSATGFEAFANTTYGASILGYGSSYDVALFDHNGSPRFGITPSGVPTALNGLDIVGSLSYMGSGGTDFTIINGQAGGLIYMADQNGHIFQTYSSGWKTRFTIADNSDATFQGDAFSITLTMGAGGTRMVMGSGAFGPGSSGPIISLGRNTDGGGTGAGSVDFMQKDGTHGYVWRDNSNQMRVDTSPPISSNDTGGTVIGTQSSARDSKYIYAEYTDDRTALATLLGSRLYEYSYKSGAFGGQRFIGITTDDSPTFGMDRDGMHPGGKSFNTPTAFGYTVAAIRELERRLTRVEWFGRTPLQVT